MAGVKGRSGGARPNTGGARPGAGRKPKAKPETPAAPPVAPEAPPSEVPTDPLAFLKAVMTGTIQASTIQVRAAIAAAQYVHTKKGDGGKKEEADERAKKAASGKFGASAPPLKLVGQK